eukprot:NODE_14436_length_1109_cov_5.003055.p1 GENE.NODE_14436_length_1109_cov_5.003055~~NODE_14436_length_1109_cov_5.003055.p1  ORF type:complete len:350 (+),score=68.71 NODE_14436_length_1109_cov_5.003055:88-1050(+)
MALESLDAQFVHAISVENDKHCKKVIEASFKPHAFLDDITKARSATFPHYDVIVAGSPCQPFSLKGSRCGWDDPRAAPIVSTIALIEETMPKAFLMEEVASVTHKPHITETVQILDHLTSVRKIVGGVTVRFVVTLEELNTLRWLPQSRPRAYIVGIRSDVLEHKFRWPVGTGPKTNIDEYLDNDASDDARRLPPVSQTVARANVVKALTQIRAQGGTPLTSTYVIDCDSQNVSWRLGASMCLTASRLGGASLWISTKGRRMHVHEAMRLQGTPPARLAQVVSPKKLGHMVGNAMSVPVIAELLAAMATAAPSAFGYQRL